MDKTYCIILNDCDNLEIVYAFENQKDRDEILKSYGDMYSAYDIKINSKYEVIEPVFQLLYTPAFQDCVRLEVNRTDNIEYIIVKNNKIEGAKYTVPKEIFYGTEEEQLNYLKNKSEMIESILEKNKDKTVEELEELLDIGVSFY